MKSTDLQKNELMEVLRLGYWPVKFLSEQHHWLAEGEPIDDSGTPGYIENDNDICGYSFKCWIADAIIIELDVLQGNILEIDGDSRLEFNCYNMNTQVDIAREVYTITGFDQISDLVDSKWSNFVLSTWPLINVEFQKNMDYYKDKCEDRDAEIHHELSLFAWKNFNTKLRDDLVNCLFYDWSALDIIEKWIKK